MDLSLTEEQEAFRHSVRSLAEDTFPTAAVRACERDMEASLPFFRQMFEIGTGGILIAEHEGGLALGHTEMVVVQSEIGRALAPVLFTESTILAARLLSEGCSLESRALLPKLASGEVLVTCAFHEEADRSTFSRPASALTGTGNLATLCGTKIMVAQPRQASHFIATARDNAGEDVLCLVQRDAAGIEIAEQPNLADMSLATVRFSDSPISGIVARGSAAAAAWESALASMRLAIAAQAVGGAERILEITREYACTREQFGQPIGAFQAIAHMIAEAAVNLEGSRLLVYRAAAAADQREDCINWADLAKMKACQMFRDISAMAIQVHGGIGFTLEADPQLFYRRAKHLQLMYGDPLTLQERAGAAILSGAHRVLEA